MGKIKTLGPTKAKRMYHWRHIPKVLKEFSKHKRNQASWKCEPTKNND